MEEKFEEKVIEYPNPYAILNKSHQGKWVVLSIDCTKILQVSDNFPDVSNMKRREILIMKVLPDATYIPYYRTL